METEEEKQAKTNGERPADWPEHRDRPPGWAWIANGFRRRHVVRALVIQERGDVEVKVAGGRSVEASTGTYGVESRARFWNHRWIPPGWVSFYTENDPEPITTRPPVGYTAKDVEHMLGDYPTHVIGAGFRERGLRPDWRWVVIGVVVLLTLLGGGAYFYYTYGGVV